VHRVGGGGGDRDPGAVGGDGHVVGAVTRHREAPVDPAGGEVQGDDVGEAGPGDHHRAAVRGGVHVVDQLVVSLADAVADGHEVDPADRVGVDLCHPLLAVGDDVDPADLREVAAGRDDVGGELGRASCRDWSSDVCSSVLGPGDHHRAAVRGGVHVVDQLVVSLADAVADGHEVDPADRVGVDLCHPLLAVGDDVDPADLREVAAGRDDVGG